jgi:maleylpyruvate isomerase
VKPPLAAVSQAHRRLIEVIADLTDAQVAEPSLLPGWTRGHVLAHLADAARARCRVIEHALRGEQVALWEPGERDAIIEATASRTAAEHRAATTEHSTNLDRLWASIPDWSVPSDPDTPDPIPPVFTRWRELWIHMVDLDLGIHPTDWTTDFSCHTIDILFPRLPDNTSLHPTDVPRTWGTGTPITAPAHDLAAWLVGRTPTTLPTSPTPLPTLGPWPTYPTRR